MKQLIMNIFSKIKSNKEIEIIPEMLINTSDNMI